LTDSALLASPSRLASMLSRWDCAAPDQRVDGQRRDLRVVALDDLQGLPHAELALDADSAIDAPALAR
jgi:hypothetical protein